MSLGDTANVLNIAVWVSAVLGVVRWSHARGKSRGLAVGQTAAATGAEIAEALRPSDPKP